MAGNLVLRLWFLIYPVFFGVCVYIAASSQNFFLGLGYNRSDSEPLMTALFVLLLSVWTLLPLSGLNWPRVRIVLASALCLIFLNLLYSYLRVVDHEGSLAQLMGTFDAYLVFGSLLYCLFICLFSFYWFSRERDDFVLREVIRIDEVDFLKAELLPSLDPEVASIVVSLAREAQRLKRRAYFALYGVAFIVLLAVLAVIFAGRLTDADQVNSSVITMAQSQEDDARGTVINLRDKKARLNGRIQQEAQSIQEKLEADDSVTEDEQELVELRDELRDIERDIISAELQLSTAIVLTNSVRQSVFEGLTNKSDAAATNSLIASAVTRFGLVILLTFFAQALINLYRYSVKLSAFYWSKALVVAFSKGKTNVLPKMWEVFSPLQVTMGREPKFSLDEISKVINSAKGN